MREVDENLAQWASHHNGERGNVGGGPPEGIMFKFFIFTSFWYIFCRYLKINFLKARFVSIFEFEIGTFLKFKLVCQ